MKGVARRGDAGKGSQTARAKTFSNENLRRKEIYVLKSNTKFRKKSSNASRSVLIKASARHGKAENGSQTGRRSFKKKQMFNSGIRDRRKHYSV